MTPEQRPPFKVTGLDSLSKDMLGKSVVLTYEIWDKAGEGFEAEAHIDNLTQEKVLDVVVHVFKNMHLMDMSPNDIEEVIVRSVKIKKR